MEIKYKELKKIFKDSIINDSNIQKIRLIENKKQQEELEKEMEKEK